MVSVALVFGLASVAPVVIPPGVHLEYQRALYAASADLERGDTAAATGKLSWLPGSEVRLGWDVSQVPADQREMLAAARDEAIALWKRVPSLPPVKVAPNPQVVITFVSQMPDGVGGQEKFSESAAPRLTYTIALRKGSPVFPVNRTEVRNEIAHAIGSYLGVATTPVFGSAGSRTDLQTGNRIGIMAADIITIQKAAEVASTLRKGAESGSRVTLDSPSAKVEVVTPDAGIAEQGSRAPFLFRLTNTGKGPLVFRAAGDCGCVLAPPPGEVAPGATVDLHPAIDTTEFTGRLDKKVILTTNDPSQPVQILDITVSIRPKFRWIMTTPSTLLTDGGSAEAVAFFFPPDDYRGPTPTFELEGIAGTVRAEPWSGSMADERFQESETPRKGYRVVATITEASGGRIAGSLIANTEDIKFPVTRQQIYVQRGIVALPGDLYLGTIDGKDRQFYGLISRPGRPFEIERIDGDLTYLKVEPRKQEDGAEYRLAVTYTGGAPVGNLQGVIRIHTNDPKQPLIEIPYRGTIL